MKLDFLNMNVGEAVHAIKRHAKNSGKAVSEKLARRTLERNLIGWKKTARDYEQNGVPAGHDYYVFLLNRCYQAIAEFANEYGKDKDLIEREYPFLFALKQKACPKSEVDRDPKRLSLAWGTAALVGLAVACFSIGCSSGLYQSGQHLVARLLG